MPNGGSDHCGNCRHNRVNIGRTPTMDERRGPAFCTVRGVEIRSSMSTYCANHYVPDRTPIGPIYAEHDEHDRIPYLGGKRPRSANVARCEVCGGASKDAWGVEVERAGGGMLGFCDSRHYRRWWKDQHPGESLKWDPEAG